jgi:hypothetical protein
MFARGQWAVFGVEPASLVTFQQSLNNKLLMLESSQYAASIMTRVMSKVSVGINPFANPRLDETAGGDVEPIVSYLSADRDEKNNVKLDEAVLDDAAQYFGSDEAEFALGNQKYAFWVVLNDYQDVTDPASKKEQLAYNNIGRPFKFLNKEEKKTVEDMVKAEAVMSRKQFPVLVDFQHGRVYAETAKADHIMAVRDLLAALGAKTTSLRWDFESYDWTTKLLKYVVDNNRYATEMQQRADDLARFRPDEIEKLEDKQVEKIVENFFTASPMETEQWAGLSTPARIRLHPNSDPVSTSSPSNAFELLKGQGATVAAASVVFQELASRYSKKLEQEIVYRNDLFSLDINDNINLQDVGAALLRGFDLPQFKKDLKVALKAKGSLDIKDFWYMWLDGMHNAVLVFIDNAVTVLQLDRKKFGLTEYGEVEESEVENEG